MDTKSTKTTGERVSDETAPVANFIKDLIDEDLKNNKNDGRVATRFPPEPNGYLHIGHAKAILLNFGLSQEYKGTFNLRFDDTNPTKEETEYVESIQNDIRWLGCDWQDRLFFASDYFEQLYLWAEQMIEDGLAYVDEQTEEDIRNTRGNFYKVGTESPYRNRPASESLDLFRRMRAGEFPDGKLVLRAKIDMAHPNMNMRDPIMYRIRHASHHRTGDAWCIYPMYDYAHGQSDAIEKITHSICSLEFEDHRPLYEWFLQAIRIEQPPRQIEFARLNLDYTVMSKRRLLQLVQEKHVQGWNDPRMPTLSGMRRLGYPPEAIRNFCDRIGVAKADSVVDIALLEFCVREYLNETVPRVMAVLDPVKLVIDNFPEDQVEWIDAPYMPEDFSRGSRQVPFCRELFVERDDFREEAPAKWHRLAPGKEVRLRYACLVTCTDVVKDSNGRVTELHCTWDPESRGGVASDGRKVKGTIHWVSARHAINAEVRLYDRLFAKSNPMDNKDGSDFLDHINPDSLKILPGCKLEPALADAKPEDRFQFERIGYFCVDPDTRDGHPVFNRTVTLRDTWAKIEKQEPPAPPKPEKKPEIKSEKEPTEVSIDDFHKLDLRVGVVAEASLVEGADKLVRLMIDLGEEKPRQIFSGIRASYPDPAALVGKQVMVLANLKPRKMKFGLSEGMVLAGGAGEKWFVVTFDGQLAPGDKVT